MKDDPIEGLMLTAMESIRNMIDVNTIVGETIVISDSVSIIPVSRLRFGLASGGSEFNGETTENYMKKHDEEELIQYKLPFGGGAGVGASISPIAFIVIQGETVKLLPVEHPNTIDKLLDYTPDIIDKIENIFNNNHNVENNSN